MLCQHRVGSGICWPGIDLTLQLTIKLKVNNFKLKNVTYSLMAKNRTMRPSSASSRLCKATISSVSNLKLKIFWIKNMYCLQYCGTVYSSINVLFYLTKWILIVANKNINTVKFSTIRSGFVLLGMTQMPFWTMNRNNTWAGVLPCFFATLTNTPFSNISGKFLLLFKKHHTHKISV